MSGLGIPFLPGSSFADPTRTNFSKSHTLAFINGVPNVDDEKPGIGGTLKPGQKPQKRPANILGETRGAEYLDEYADAVPAWVAYDKKVLCFSAYFQEAVTESANEFYRVRRVKILYYLEDHSIQVTEPTSQDAGYPQGDFLKRHRVPVDPEAADSDFLTLHDISIGKEINFYGRTMRVYDCDDFTRSFLTDLGITVPAAEDVPSDPYTQKRELQKNARRLTVGKGPNDSLANFLRNDRKVLRFYSIWDDRRNMFGDQRQFIIHYYLSDDTVEVLERLKANSGRDPFPVFTKRQRMPLTATGVLDIRSCKEFVHFENLNVGGTVEVLGRQMFIYDCDSFTKGFLREVRGIDSLPVFEVEERGPQLPPKVIPPYTGFGSEEDSLASCTQLVPKPPKKDFAKQMANEGIALRFMAQLDTEKPEDIDRRFIISYYLADDTIGVFEPPQRNSGFIGGKFLERKKIRRSPTAYYQASDFFVGAQVEINRFLFILIDADQYAFSHMEERPDEFPLSDVNLIHEKLKQYLYERSSQAWEVFRRIDENHDGVINFDEFRNLLLSMDFHLNEQEIITLMRKYDHNGDGVINLNEFASVIKPPEA